MWYTKFGTSGDVVLSSRVRLARNIKGIPFGAKMTAEMEEKVIEQGPPQVTIYEYRAANKKCLCALCDGENDPSATRCHVCGQQLS